MIHPISRSQRSQRSDSGETGMSLRSGMERFFEQFLEPFTGSGFGSMSAMHVPPMEIYEANNEMIVTAELPGMKPDDINVTVTGNQLVVSGEKRDDNEERRGNSYRSERRYGMFRRVLELPYEINPNDINVEFDNGLLKLRIPQSAAQQPHRIPIKGSSGQSSSRQDQSSSPSSGSSSGSQVGGRFQNRGDGGSAGDSTRQSQGGSGNQRT